MCSATRSAEPATSISDTSFKSANQYNSVLTCTCHSPASENHLGSPHLTVVLLEYQNLVQPFEFLKQMSSDDRDTSGWSAKAYQTAVPYVYALESINPVLALLDARPGERIVDFGCGSGEVTKVIADIVGPKGQVVGVDSSESMVSVRERSLLDAVGSAPEPFGLEFQQYRASQAAPHRIDSRLTMEHR